MQTIQVFEHERLDVGQKGFTSSHFEALARFHETESQFFSLWNQAIRFSQYVGVLKVGDLMIEILPKIDRYKEENTNLWRNVLLQMLVRSQTIPVYSNQSAHLQVAKHSFFYAFIQLFLREVEGIIANGLVKKYRTNEGNQSALKGRLLFGKQVAQNIVHKERFYVAHTTYDTQHILHQIIFKTLNIIQKIGGDYQPNLARILFDFPEMPDIKVSEKLFDTLVFSRNTAHYRQAISLAKMILLNYYPDVQRGKQDVLAILFDMNQLWEKFILTEMQKQILDYEVNGQESTLFWQNKTIRPDIVLKPKNPNSSQKNIIIDTKWKIPENNSPSDEDLKQMFSYHLYFDSPTTILLYPSNKQNKDLAGSFASYPFSIGGKLLKMCFLDILNKDGNIKEILDWEM